MYLKTLSVVLFSVLFLVAESSPLQLRVPHVVHEKRGISSTWVKRSRVPPNTRLPVRIALSQNNIQSSHDLLMEM